MNWDKGLVTLAVLLACVIGYTAYMLFDRWCTYMERTRPPSIDDWLPKNEPQQWIVGDKGVEKRKPTAKSSS